jgi:hypothetical protein
MSSFKDAVGRLWVIEANTASIKRVRLMTQVDLLNVFDGKLYPQLLNDSVLMSEVAWAFVQPKAAIMPVTQAQFDESLDGNAIAGMNAAVSEAMISFFQNDKPETAAGLSKMLEMRTQMGQAVIKRIGEMTLESVMATIDKSKTPTASESSSTNLPASSESIPVP